MVTRYALLVSLVALFVVACGGDDNSNAQGTSGPLPPARTAAPANTPSGPRAIVEPHSGPPGTQVTVRGSGWAPGELVDVTGELSPGASAAPYETVVSDADGTFTASFRLERTPDGVDLMTGRYDLIARSVTTQVTIPFQVESRRPVGNSGPSG
jgi:hypothetical protein